MGRGLIVATVSARDPLANQTVWLVFETLIWLSPVPLVDAIFETDNKISCAWLVAIYAFSPSASLAIYLALFVICALFARTAYRRWNSFRNDLLIPAARRIAKKFF